MLFRSVYNEESPPRKPLVNARSEMLWLALHSHPRAVARYGIWNTSFYVQVTKLLGRWPLPLVKPPVSGMGVTYAKEERSSEGGRQRPWGGWERAGVRWSGLRVQGSLSLLLNHWLALVKYTLHYVLCPPGFALGRGRFCGDPGFAGARSRPQARAVPLPASQNRRRKLDPASESRLNHSDGLRRVIA